MAINDLNQKFAHELGDIYDAEHRFLDAQKEMLNLASAPQLKSMIQQHIQQTEQQIRNLDEIHNHLGKKPQRVKCDAAAGLVSEGQKTTKEAAGNPSVLDCVIAGSLAKVEHYEVASYRGLVTGAQMMGQQDILQLLQQNLQQEEQTANLIEQNTPQLLQLAMSAQERGA
ncbi:MAG TPA: DUF892 family protein [Roseiflexaceae bacterium]|nr:DUF892 family protein [Roseiflexaceae bacterium]